ncbi:Putative metabolite transport protein NicT [Pseudomonas mediterranea]|nr:Putative metabolite transport protein NicT [Pseudomonas mediterranea]
MPEHQTGHWSTDQAREGRGQEECGGDAATVALREPQSKVWRIMPLIMICYLFAFFDRINISFAKFQLQADLSLSDTAYGLGAGLFVVGYVLFEGVRAYWPVVGLEGGGTGR